MVTIAVGDMYPGCTVMGNDGQTNDCEILLGAKDTLMGEDATRMLDWSEDTPIARLGRREETVRFGARGMVVPPWRELEGRD